MNTDNVNDQSKEQQPLTLKERTDLPEEQLLNDIELRKEKSKKRHNRALTAASIARSAVGHASSHRVINKRGDFAHSGTNISYDN
ncbi:MAG: hypothetical protein JWQ40_4914 [Segetibacter sp.]|nr:hypothetical protein [Segetibacter sp.]